MVRERISSQHVFGYMKYILYPEDYKQTEIGKQNLKESRTETGKP